MLNTPDNRIPQPFRNSVKDVLLRCVDMAETAYDAKAMILTMYESSLLSAADTFAEIVCRNLEEA